MSSSDDEFRDPTAPPPLPEDPAVSEDTAGDTPDVAPATDDTQVVESGGTRAFEPPSPGYEQPTYSQPTYSTPSYDRPSYDQPAAAPPAATWPPPPAPYPYGAPGGAPQAGAPAPDAGRTPGYAAYPPPANPYQQGAAAQYPYGAPPSIYGVPQRNTSALVLTIISGILVASCCGALTLPALILGIIGLTKQGDDPEGSRRMSRYGWIAFTVAVVLTVVGVVALGIIGAVADGSSSSSYDGY